jgi:hypothetical protein
MPTLQRAILATLLFVGHVAHAQAQIQSDPLDDLLIIPRPGAQAPTITPYEGIPQVADPFAGQGPMDLDAPLWSDPGAQQVPPQSHTLGLGGNALPAEPEATPFFEFTDEAQPAATPDDRPGMSHPQLEGPGTITSHGQVLWPGDIRTPANEPVPTLGSNAIADLLEPGSGAGTNMVAAQPPNLPADAGFTFQETPAQPASGGPMLPVPPTSNVVGYHAIAGGTDQEWAAQAQGVGVVRIDLPAGTGGTVLALSSEVPIFWGITAPQGARVDGILLYGPQAAYNTIGVRTLGKERSNVVRRPDLDRAGAEALLRQGGATAVRWQ